MFVTKNYVLLLSDIRHFNTYLIYIYNIQGDSHYMRQTLRAEVILIIKVHMSICPKRFGFKVIECY